MHDLRAAKILVLAALAMVLVLTTNFSTAAFTSSSTSTATVRAAADWTPPTVEVLGLASTFKGDITLAATASDNESGIAGVTIERRRSGTTTWVDVCVATRAPYSCTWRTAGTDDGRHEVRASATDGAGYSTVSSIAVIVVDNTAPTVTMKDPGSPLNGTKTFEATGVADATSGVARVDIQYALGSGTWQNLCTVLGPTSTWSCSYDTRALPNGSHSFRAIATDVAGNPRTSAAVPGRVVDNTAASISLKDPGTVLAGSVTLEATASSTAGVTSVRFEYAPSGTNAWSVIGTDLTAPYSLGWSTTAVTNGVYDLRAVMVHGTDATTTASAVLGARRVENAPLLAGLDVQAVSGTSPGMVSTGDGITFTYTRRVDMSTLVTGWDGTAMPVTVRLRDGRVPGLGLGNKDTILDVLDGSTPVNLGSVNVREGYLGNGSTVMFAGSMIASTTVVGGIERSTITVVLGQPTSGASELKNVPTAQTMAWYPSGKVTDLLGRASATTETHETGALDVDF